MNTFLIYKKAEASQKLLKLYYSVIQFKYLKYASHFHNNSFCSTFHNKGFFSLIFQRQTRRIEMFNVEIFFMYNK